MKNILCPINFTDTALNALEYACRLAALHGASISLLHVLTDEKYNELLEKEAETERENLLKEEPERIGADLARICREIALDFPGIQCRATLAYGSLSGSIVEHAAENNCELIVMGNDGVRNVREAWEGSTTVKVIGKAPCAVLCVPYQASFTGLKRVIYGSDLSGTDREALLQLQGMLKPSLSHIDVIHLEKEDDREIQEQDRQKLEELERVLDNPALSYELRATRNSVRGELDRLMQDNSADLLVLLTHKRNYLERVFQNSVFKELSYFATYPLLIFLEENLQREEK